MSYRVLVIPEDATYDQYILKPLVEAMLERIGRQPARVVVLQRTGTQGFSSAFQFAKQELVHSPPADLVLFMPDRDRQDGVDGRENRVAELRRLETTLRADGYSFHACAAVEEIEVWLMAGHPEKLRELGTDLPRVRLEIKPSQGTFRPFLTRYGDSSPGRGRKRLMMEAVANLDRILQSCPELQELLESLARG